jgi:hypothetical protein
VQPLTDLRRARGGYVVADTGEWLKSPWRFLGFQPLPPMLLFELVSDHHCIKEQVDTVEHSAV